MLNRQTIVLLVLVAAAGVMAVMIGTGRLESDPEPALEKAPSPYVLKHEMNRIDGTKESLEKYKGKVVLIVNTASKCGLTPQYEALESVYREYKDRGLVILGFPANNFMGQEPGSNNEIAEFCTERFEVSFPMFEKISVKGDKTHPLYKQLASQPKPAGGAPNWNFTKYLIDREGKAVIRFDPKVTPKDKKITTEIEKLLGKG